MERLLLPPTPVPVTAVGLPNGPDHPAPHHRAPSALDDPPLSPLLPKPSAHRPPSSAMHRPSPAAQRPSAAPSPRPQPSPSDSGSPAALAALLAASYNEIEDLKSQLAAAHERADQAERLANAPHANGASHPNGGTREVLAKTLAEAEDRVRRAELQRDEAEARLKCITELWQELDRYLATAEYRVADARQGFARVVAEGGGQIVVTPLAPPGQPIPPSIALGTARPAPSTAPLPNGLPAFSGATRPLAHLPASPVARRPPSPTIPYASASYRAQGYAPQPNGHRTYPSPRVRARADSVDRAYSAGGAQPPSKKRRDDGERVAYPPPSQYDESPVMSAQATRKHADEAGSRSRYPDERHARRERAERYGPGQPRPPVAADNGRRSRHREHPKEYYERRDDAERGRSRLHRDVQRSHSSARSSSPSVDEMLLEAAAATDDRARSGSAGPVRHPLSPQPIYANGSGPHPGPGYTPHGPGYPPYPSGPGSAAYSPSTAPSHGPLPSPGQMQTYQTHVFAPPVTGAPIKRGKGGPPSLQAVSGQPSGSMMTIGPNGTVISGPSQVGSGGYPATNAQGQRICRQCGMAGRYKDGKCVEKWGPGPEGPGTVCDRCRKKMKRVERRGTMENGSQGALGASPHYRPQEHDPSRHGAAPLGPRGTQLLEPPQQTYHFKDQTAKHARPPPTASHKSSGSGSTVPDADSPLSSMSDGDGSPDASSIRPMDVDPLGPASRGGAAVVPGGDDAEGDMLDTDGDADADGDDVAGEGDADAELLEAVDAADAANAEVKDEDDVDRVIPA